MSRSPLRVEGPPPRVDEALDAKALGGGGLLPLLLVVVVVVVVVVLVVVICKQIRAASQ